VTDSVNGKELCSRVSKHFTARRI